jgi:hypothetical protein
MAEIASSPQILQADLHMELKAPDPVFLPASKTLR